MFEAIVDFRDEEQKRRVLNLFSLMLSENKRLDFVRLEYLKDHLKDIDIPVFLDFLTKYLESKKYEMVQEKQEQTTIHKEYTPYSILGIEEREYTREELIEIARNRINFIKDTSTDYNQLKKNTDEILNAYSALTQQKQR